MWAKTSQEYYKTKGVKIWLSYRIGILFYHFLWIFRVVWICVSVYENMHMSVGACTGERLWMPLELELREVVSKGCWEKNPCSLEDQLMLFITVFIPGEKEISKWICLADLIQVFNLFVVSPLLVWRTTLPFYSLRWRLDLESLV